ncbi:MAG: hypothetical protein KAX24_08295 [Anaerolineae bacterium]|nr:hypothetical protein [Anaerolineae bacterium]
MNTGTEEFPYAEDRQAVQPVLMKERGRAELTLLSEEALEARIATIACYHSQLSTLWPDVVEMAAAVRLFAERYWLLAA